MAAIELYTPQGAEMVSGMIYEPYEQAVIMRLEHHLVGGYVRYISPHIIIIIIIMKLGPDICLSRLFRHHSLCDIFYFMCVRAPMHSKYQLKHEHLP